MADAVLAAAMCAYFSFTQGNPAEFFVFQTCEPQRIAEAREILAGKRIAQPQGRIVKRPAPYNPLWRYHLDPASIAFFEMAIEVCDANMNYVEQHLDEVGGSLLPGGRWCPWNARLTAEVTGDIDPTSGALRQRP